MRCRYHCLLTIVGCAFGLTAADGAQQHASPEHTWDYGASRGPGHWGWLKPEFAPCKNGHRQSPVDIHHPQKADLPAIQSDYKPSPLNIVDNGHTIMINYSPGSFITVGGNRYELKQFHFQRPSEEKINGKGYEMTVHLVHADEKGNVAVVAVESTLSSKNQATILPKIRMSRLKGSVPKRNGPISIEEMNIASEAGATERHRR